jgi:hypothetical protein
MFYAFIKNSLLFKLIKNDLEGNARYVSAPVHLADFLLSLQQVHGRNAMPPGEPASTKAARLSHPFRTEPSIARICFRCYFSLISSGFRK